MCNRLSLTTQHIFQKYIAICFCTYASMISLIDLQNESSYRTHGAINKQGRILNFSRSTLSQQGKPWWQEQILYKYPWGNDVSLGSDLESGILHVHCWYVKLFNSLHMHSFYYKAIEQDVSKHRSYAAWHYFEILRTLADWSVYLFYKVILYRHRVMWLKTPAGLRTEIQSTFSKTSKEMTLLFWPGAALCISAPCRI